MKKDKIQRKKIKKEIDEDVKEEKKIKKKHKRRRFRFWYWFMVLIVVFALLCFLGAAGFCYYIVKSAPEFDTQKMFEKEATRIFDSKGELIATLGTEQRQKITYDQLPQVLVDAIIATEDSRFFQHNGFDAPRFIKASIQQVLGRGGGGASTLTMQLSKLAFTSTNTEGFAGIVRKFTDIYMAVFKMERNFTKEEIIEYYVNTPCMGGSIYGVQQASQYYFGKDVSDLNLVEAAQIAGMFQSPNGYNPYLNPNDANDRKNTVLYLMKRHGYITENEYKAGTSVKIKDFLKSGTTKANEYQGFIDTVVVEIERDTGNNPYDVSMDVYTTMVKKKQDIINNFYKTYKFRDKKIEIGIGVIENKTGAIIAVGAGRDKSKAMTLNVATFDNQVYKRMPGSTAKPILDYGPAIEYANLSTYGPFIDDKTPYGGGNMRNFNGSYKGFMTMRDCLRNSINTCALQAFRLTNNEQKKEFAGKLGIEFDVETIPDSYAIGAFNGVSPVQLASAYSAFGNNGKRSTPHSYTKIVYRETEEEYKKEIKTEQVMKPQTAYIISTILTSATTSRVHVSGTQVATKTGTTSYDTSELRKYGLTSSVIPDSWTSSYTTDYAMAIWYGYTDGLSKENVKKKWYLPNGHASVERLKIQGKLANKIYEKNARFKNPGGISSAKVELETIPAEKPSAYTPSKMIGTFLFVGNTTPSETSIRYDKLTNPSNVTYSFDTNKINLSWTSPGIPNAIDTEYVTNYFKENWKIQTDKYLKKRLNYNKSSIGDFGFAIYLTKGTESTYVGWTQDTTYSIDTTKFTGIYDGVIIKSMYSIFKSNASDGIKIVFTMPTQPESQVTPTDTITIDENDVNVSMNNLSLNLALKAAYSELNSSNITSITYKSNDIKSQVTNLSVTTSSVSKSDGTSIAPNQITQEAGTYKVVYSVSFVYSGKNITKSFTQNITVQ